MNKEMGVRWSYLCVFFEWYECRDKWIFVSKRMHICMVFWYFFWVLKCRYLSILGVFLSAILCTNCRGDGKRCFGSFGIVLYISLAF